MSPGGFRTIAVIGKYQAPEVTEALLTLIAYLRGRDLDVLVERDTAAAADAPGFEEASYEEIAGRADMAIVIGGDGTMLATARRLAASAVPLVYSKLSPGRSRGCSPTTPRPLTSWVTFSASVMIQ